MLHANLLSIIILLFALSLCYAFKSRIFHDFDKFIRRAAVIVFLSGVVIYFIGFREGHEALGTQQSWLASLFRPMLASLEMFVSKNELIEVGEECKQSMVYMTLFSLIHFAAVAVAFAVAIHYLGVRTRSWWRWNKLKRAKELNGNVEVFFGLNLSTLGLAQNIKKNHPNDVIVFIDAPEPNTQQGMLGMTSIFNVFGMKRDVMVQADRLDAVIKRVKRPIHLMEGNNILEQTGLIPLLKKSKEYNGFYLLYGDHQLNVAKTLKLRNDEFLASTEAKKAYIFCKATQGQTNGGLLFEYTGKQGVETILVDSAYLSAVDLLKMPKLHEETHEPLPHQYVAHPINYVEVDNEKGLALSPFNCLIIGFGETGQNALEFLYEHGQFEYPADYTGKRFSAHIVDPTIEEKQGHFLMERPALSKESGLSNISADLHWHKMKAGTMEFWKFMSEEIDNINYVVIAAGSDDLNMSLSADLCNFAIRWRKQRFANFAVFMRSYKYNNETHFDHLSSRVIDYDFRPVIHTFGKVTNIITYKYLWKNYLNQEAAIFNYSQENGKEKDFLEAYLPKAAEATELWQNRHNASRTDAYEYANIKREENQQFGQTYHIYTMMRMLGLDDPYNKQGQKNKEMLLQAKTLEDLEKLPFFDNLVKHEYLRWIANNEAQGYTPMSLDEYNEWMGMYICDPGRYKHLCMVPFDKLGELPVYEPLKANTPESYQSNIYEYYFKEVVRTLLATIIHDN